MAELDIANEKNDGNRIAIIHTQLDTIDAWTIQSRAATLLNGLGFSTEQLQTAGEILLRWLAYAVKFGTSSDLSFRSVIA
ncbi:Uncharacterized ABC transporter ATP-binding protein HI_0658 [Mannheimia haemolytica]|uniref:Uncharacterized ABC transporter ATP-binding protein HI_0658 n=1 Tax=Mannheimia haemolytica TaxID=75985 RepID=A0A378N939_MANHA|nr:Uncharacterized ABC transporter ATP-binding protein HI_0658 [Mannheimia haemolytica]